MDDEINAYLITGIIGRIGGLLARKILADALAANEPAHIIGVTRLPDRVADYAGASRCDRFGLAVYTYVPWSEERAVPTHIFHCADQTKSKKMIALLVATTDGIVLGWN